MYSVATRVTRYLLNGLGVELRGEVRDFLFSKTHTEEPWCPSGLLNWVTGPLPRVKLSERGVEHTPPSSSEVRSVGAIPLLVLCA